MSSPLPAAGLVWPIALTLLRRVGESVTARRRGTNRPHKGIDLFAPTGSPVLAAYPGIVLRTVDGTVDGASDSQRRAGWFIDVRGRDGNIYRYLHLGGPPSVRTGQQVAYGMKIGIVGTSGIEHSGPHIHFEIRSSDYDYNQKDYGTPIDPLLRLPELGGPDLEPSLRSDADVALSYLLEQGWSEQAARQLLQRRTQATGNAGIEQQLLRIGWSPAEVRALLAGPPKRGTAEGFLDRVKGSAPDVRAQFDEVLRQAGLGTLDLPATPGQPASGSSVSSLVKAFAALPQAQQLRLLGTIRESGGKQTDSSGSKDLSYLPIVKSGVEAITQIIKAIGKGGGEAPDKGGSKGPPAGDDKPPVIRDKDSEPFDNSDTDTAPPIVAEDDRSDVPSDSLPDSETDTGSTSEPD